ncbi:gliding motility-associated peptidyl-prolyl isomerase GldI [Flavobacterium selenitireducens]|uniref:gliding motility-associated peptidyl-prolyl isomerase GldI n=1 Tax=Flavobacterium selenitireducens TaxID=2722704 RepID=UPI00168A80FB|nr:gliding motility-associated peptidyl-prolyl isomerase GldI [Flavobacterium selenitireducens]MBD3583589.1 gliding motility-associated peptidyl-prolyl isomerase GldI [Flavobacterium selenitireducens]
MKKTKIALLLMLSVFAVCCSQQQPRRPISQSSGTFMKESAERNKKLIAGEEDKIDSIIKSEPNRKYTGSKKGYWYTYIKQNTTDTIRPKKGDVAFYTYELSDLDGNVIYSALELRPQEYHVDKEQKIIMGLRHGIKLMRKNETVRFLFPSHMGYGYHGDNRRIGHNQPLIATVTLTDIKPENQTTTE